MAEPWLEKCGGNAVPNTRREAKTPHNKQAASSGGELSDTKGYERLEPMKGVSYLRREGKM